MFATMLTQSEMLSSCMAAWTSTCCFIGSCFIMWVLPQLFWRLLGTTLKQLQTAPSRANLYSVCAVSHLLSRSTSRQSAVLAVGRIGAHIGACFCFVLEQRVAELCNHTIVFTKELLQLFNLLMELVQLLQTNNLIGYCQTHEIINGRVKTCLTISNTFNIFYLFLYNILFWNYSDCISRSETKISSEFL